ncbi:MAG: hypothetical protein A2284_08595 [Deltaproteobacteria bacterium RIFOXYA12_FULL_61_11]|nr:MAG: hypothetical protein A2284_08595 [Deltaproteobacteria bacterium RIFOXYA12_FULL_61_11]
MKFLACGVVLGILLGLPALAEQAPVTRVIDLDDLFVSTSFQVRAPSVDFAGVGITEGTDTKYTGVGSKVAIAMRRMLDGKSSFNFLPSSLYRFIGINPDMIIKTLPFSHYFSYIFDITSYLPVKSTSKPSDPLFSIFKIHTGDPACNSHITRLAPKMMIQFKEIKEGTVAKGYTLVDPEGKEYTALEYGFAEVIFHTSFAYWGDVINRIKQWFKKGTGDVIDDVSEKVDQELRTALASGDYDTVLAALEASEGTNIFWEIFKELNDGIHVNTGNFNELFDIIKDISLSETVVSGVGKDGARSAGMLYEIGTTLPFPNLEMFVHLIKQIVAGIIGIPKLIIGFPKNDLRIAVVTRYISEQFYEVTRIYIVPKTAAEMYYPPYTQNSAGQLVILDDGERTDPRLPISSYAR